MKVLMERTKTSRNAVRRPGQAQRQGDPGEHLELAGSQGTGGLLQLGAEPAEPGDHGQDGVGHKDLHQADGHAGHVVGELQWRVDQAQPVQGGVDQAVGSQDDHPAVGADHGGGEQRRDGDGDEQATPFAGAAGQEQGHGVGHDDAEDAHGHAHLEGVQRDFPVVRVGQGLDVGVQGERLNDDAVRCALVEGHPDHVGQREDEADQQAKEARQQQRKVGAPVAPFGGFLQLPLVLGPGPFRRRRRLAGGSCCQPLPADRLRAGGRRLRQPRKGRRRRRCGAGPRCWSASARGGCWSPTRTATARASPV